jgi:hypothetical protein
VIYYQYRAERARRTCAGSMSRSPRLRKQWPARPPPVERNLFIQLSGCPAAPTPLIGPGGQLFQINRAHDITAADLLSGDLLDALG